MKRILFVVSEDRYFVSHRLHLAIAAIECGYQVALLSRFNHHHDIIEKVGIQVFDWSLDRSSFNPFKELRAVFGLISAIQRFKPDLIHAVAIKPVLYSALVCRFTGVNSRIFALGGLGYLFSSQKRMARLFRPFFIFAFRIALIDQKSLLILQNPDDQSVLLAKGVISSDRIRLIRGAGVDINVFVPESIPSGVPLVILPARLLWDKGVGVFVECARTLINKGVRVRFALVGEPDKHNPESVSVKQLTEWVDEGVVEWWGHQNDMPDVYHQSSVVCLPTTYGEGLPKSLLEAASCARPIVTYDVPGCREIVIENVNGFLVPLKDGADLCNALEKLLEDAELCLRFGEAGRNLVLAEFSQEKIAAETMKLWDEVLN
jgi:glycosyltransferase involved in cell wall biosynthesis